MSNKKIGTLYVVATPIGNLEDITFRAVNILKNVDKIAAEDTRHGTKLLNHLSIKKPMLSLHEFNERQKTQHIIELLLNGASIALISDAGTPLISDPGYNVVQKALEADIKVVPIPGPCAAIAALSAAGLPTFKFVFEGFLPAKNKAQQDRLQELSSEMRTIIFYESPHRLISTLKNMIEYLGAERIATIARELTKLHESILKSTLGDLLTYFSEHNEFLKGEFVILVEGAQNKIDKQKMDLDSLLTLLLESLPLKKAVLLASQISGQRKNYIYELALKKTKNV